MQLEFILYVANQEASKRFYSKLFQIVPSLHVSGMTEFQFNGCKFGLMPESGIAKILCPKTIHPELGRGIPRCEIYLRVSNVEEYHQRGIDLGATEISGIEPRDWGDTVAYLSDADGHIIAFACQTSKEA